MHYQYATGRSLLRTIGIYFFTPIYMHRLQFPGLHVLVPVLYAVCVCGIVLVAESAQLLTLSQATFGTERRWRDGSLEEDLPLGALREMFNVNYFLVSQTNPHIVPILNFKNQFNRKIANMIELEWKHR